MNLTFDLDQLFMSDPMFMQHNITLSYNRLEQTGISGFDLWVSDKLYHAHIKPVIQDMVDLPCTFIGQEWHLNNFSLMVSPDIQRADKGLTLSFRKERHRSCGSCSNLRALPGTPHAEPDYIQCDSQTRSHGGRCACLRALREKEKGE